MPLGYAFLLVWALWFAYWGISAIGVKQAARVESQLSRFFKYTLALILAAVLLLWFPFWYRTPLSWRFLPYASWLPWLGLIVLIAGLGFSCWARITLGRNWSAVVQIKQDHELITAGPYRFARHPIYTGILTGFVGTTLAIGEWRAVLATLIVGLSFWRKLRLEERWMLEVFGAQYVAYMQRVKALIPGVL